MRIIRGSALVRIYRLAQGKANEQFCVAWGRPRRRKNFKAEEVALKYATEVAEKLDRGGFDVVVLKGGEKAEYLRARALLKKSDTPLLFAVEQFVEAKRALGETPLAVAVDAFQRRPKLNRKWPGEILDELIASKTAGGKSDRHIKDLGRLRRFADCFQTPLDGVDGPMIERFVRSLKLEARTQNNYRRLIQMLFIFGKRRGYVDHDHPGVSGVDRATESVKEIEVFTVEEMKKLLGAARPEVIPYFAIRAFAGLRDAEVQRLLWSDVDLAEGHIVVRHAVAKTKRRRLVPISDNLAAWLRPYGGREGNVATYKKSDKQMQILSRDSGVPWKHNALRHSYVSYSVALKGDVARVSLESGNSPQIVQRNYLKVVTKKDADAWFGISPKTVGRDLG